MKCDNCGTENRDEAVTCAICRAPLKIENNDQINYITVPNYVLWSVISIVLFSPLFGVIALIFALRANRLAAEGRIEEALKKAKTAKIWIVVSIIVAIIGFIALFIMQQLGYSNILEQYKF